MTFIDYFLVKVASVLPWNLLLTYKSLPGNALHTYEKEEVLNAGYFTEGWVPTPFRYPYTNLICSN